MRIIERTSHGDVNIRQEYEVDTLNLETFRDLYKKTSYYSPSVSDTVIEHTYNELKDKGTTELGWTVFSIG